jgi:glycosyltransferase involved in cell wall biosynthesis
MADRVARSALFGSSRIAVIPNPIDTDAWCPVPRSLARDLLRIETTRPVILFGAIGGLADARKGGDLLTNALSVIRHSLAEVQVMIFGQTFPRPEDSTVVGDARFLGRLADDLSLRIAYSAADEVVVPSRQASCGQVALEASACATPVIAFDVGGLKDIVESGVTGFLVDAFDTMALAAAAVRVLKDQTLRDSLGAAGRRRAEALFSYPVVVQQYADVYREALMPPRLPE